MSKLSDNDKRFAIATVLVLWAMLLFSADWFFTAVKGTSHKIGWEFYAIIWTLLFSGVSLLLVPIAANVERVITSYKTTKQTENGEEIIEVTDVQPITKRDSDSP